METIPSRIMVSRVIDKIVFALMAQIANLNLRSAGVKTGGRITLWGRPIISRAPGSTIEIGDRVVLCSDSRKTALGVNHAVVLRTLSPQARIIIGDDVGISGGTICAAQSVTIGAGSLLGANVTIADTDFHPSAAKERRYSRADVAVAPVAIRENVFIGTNCLILKGVEIGANSVIGAGSVVTRSIPSNVIAAGNPCRVVRPQIEESVASVVELS
jgi:acetyltransferase-like isoleucine patch superfamily enzyme